MSERRGRRLRGLLADVRPLRESPAFRRLWVGQVLSGVGTTMTQFSVVLQVYLLTGSSAAVGGVGLASALPAITFGLFGGALADAVDRRRLVLVTQAVLMAISVGLAAQAFAGARSVVLLYVLVSLESLVAAVNGPARRAFAPRLLPADLLPAASALSMLAMHFSVVGGPLLAGIIVPVAGLKACYLIDAITFLASLYATFRLPPMRPEGDLIRPGFAAVAEGLRYLFANRVLSGVLLADVSATLLAMPIALFPAINADRFGGSPHTLGLLSAAIAVGGIAGTVFSGPVSRVRRPGLGVVVAGACWGAALAGFGAVRPLSLTLLLLALAGVADVTSVVLRSTIVQLATPDALRGRINAADGIVGASVPQLGNFRAGIVASATSPAVAAGVGGVLAVAGAGLVALTFPALVRYRPGEHPPAAAALGDAAATISSSST